jgi:hypothetical protein
MGRIALLAALAIGLTVGLYTYSVRNPATCDVCRRPMHHETLYRIHLRDGSQQETCCPRCGLRFQQNRDDVTRVEVADFDARGMIDARTAFYVEASAVHLCCAEEMARRDAEGGQYVLAWDRCMPSLVAFRNREAAERFRREKGGLLKNYAQLLVEE